MWATFRSLAVPNYRRWFLGGVFSSLAVWMQTTAQSWVVLTQLTDGDALAVGLTVALQFVPQLLLVPVTGFLADRFDKRYIIACTQTTFLLLAVSLGVLLLTGVATVEVVYGFAVLVGIASAVESPARLSIANELVPPEYLSNAVALNGAVFNGARLVGPAVAGVLIAFVGSGWVFVATGAANVGMVIALSRIRTEALQRRPRVSRTAGAFTDGFRVLARSPRLMVVFGMALAMGAFGMNLPVFASTMSVYFGADASAYGVLSSIIAIGALAGSLLAARQAFPRFSRIAWGAAGFAVSTAVAAAMPTFWTFAVCLIAVGFFVPTSMATANGWVQLNTDRQFRGRVIAIFLAFFMGGTALGGPVIGGVANAFGPRWSLVVAGAASLAAASVGLWWVWRDARRAGGAGGNGPDGGGGTAP